MTTLRDILAEVEDGNLRDAAANAAGAELDAPLYVQVAGKRMPYNCRNLISISDGDHSEVQMLVLSADAEGA